MRGGSRESSPAWRSGPPLNEPGIGSLEGQEGSALGCGLAHRIRVHERSRPGYGSPSPRKEAPLHAVWCQRWLVDRNDCHGW